MTPAKTHLQSNDRSTTIRGVIKDGPAGAGNTCSSGPTPNKEGIEMTLPDADTETIILGIKDGLEASATNLRHAQAQRLHWIRHAHEIGVPWTKIGSALGISDTAARRLYQRNMNVEIRNG